MTQIKSRLYNDESSHSTAGGCPVKALAHALIRKADSVLNVPSDYLHFIVDQSFAAFLRFLFFMLFANFRKKLPREAWHLARIMSTQAVDCGTCVQITVTLAVRDRVDPRYIQAVLDQKYSSLPPELAELCAFVRHILDHSYQEDELREKLRTRYGNQALIELAYAIAAAQVFPYTKKVLGYAKSCSKGQ